MSDLSELYQAVILDHNRSPHNFGTLDDATHRADGFNPLCGDKLTVFLKLDGDRISDVRFEGSGCAISKASASMMTDSLKGKTVADAERLFERFRALVTRGHDNDDLGKLAIFAGVREFPMRVKCATLGWHTMRGALHDKDGAISTE